MGSFWVEIGMESLRSPNGPSSAFFQWKAVRGPRMGRELEKLKNFKIQALLYQRFNRNLFIS